MANRWALSRGSSDRREPGLGWRDQLRILRRVLPLMWPEGEAGLKLRVVAAFALIVAAKLVDVTLPLVYKSVIDSLTTKPNAVIGNAEHAFVVNLFQDDLHIFRFSVFHRVIDGFLGQAEKMGLNGAIRNRDIFPALDFAGHRKHAFHRGAEFAKRGAKTAGFEFDWKEAAREVSGLGQSLQHQFADFGGLLSFRQRLRSEPVFKRARQEGDPSQMLAKSIVQILADPGLLPIRDFEDFFFEQPLFGNVAHHREQFIGPADRYPRLEFSRAIWENVLAGEGLGFFGAESFFDVMHRLLANLRRQQIADGTAHQSARRKSELRVRWQKSSIAGCAVPEECKSMAWRLLNVRNLAI